MLSELKKLPRATIFIVQWIHHLQAQYLCLLHEFFLINNIKPLTSKLILICKKKKLTNVRR